MRPRLALALTALVFLLTACGETPTDVSSSVTCADVKNGLVLDRMIGAMIDGRPFRIPSAAPVGGIFLDTAGGLYDPDRLTVMGISNVDGHERILRVWFPFNGVGTFPIAYGPYAGAIYECDGAAQHGFASAPDVGGGTAGGDSAWVTTYDSATGHIEGGFAFRGIHFWNSADSGEVSVTNGTFQGTVKRAVAIPVPSCSDFANTPTPDTLIGANIDGHPFLMPSAGRIGGLFLDTLQSRFTLLAASRDGGPWRLLQMSFGPFHGVGAYSLAYSQKADAIYDCLDGAKSTSSWASVNSTDSAFVTAYDSSTGHIEGTFGFTAWDGGPPVISDGRFNGTVQKGTFLWAPPMSVARHR